MYEFYCGNVFGHVTWTRFDIFMCGQLKQLGGRRGQIIVYHRQTVLIYKANIYGCKRRPYIDNKDTGILHHKNLEDL